MCVCVVSVTVKRPVLPPSVVNGRSRNPLYYYYYVRAWTLYCFHSIISTHSFRRALTASMDSCADMKSAPLVAYVTNSGKIWRKVMKTMLGVWVVLFC